jgi:2-polyprenyl-3-methyl-5-hydroxy-6-metoxy-1,4-benzoquinol methylase
MTAETSRYWEDRHAPEESLNTVGWKGLGRSFNRWMYAVRRHVFEDVVSELLRRKQDPRVLDVGSGTGFYLEIWQRLGVSRLEGSDLSERAVSRLRDAFPSVSIHRFDLGAADLELSSGRYDVISAMDVLFHIVDEPGYQQAVYNLARLLAPGGHLVMSENLLADEVLHGPVQVSRTEAEVLRLLREAGLHVVDRIPMFVLLNNPVDSRSRLLRGWWTLLTKLVSMHEGLGWLFGASLMPVELLALRLVKRGPSTKLLVCRRAASV